MLGGKTEMKQTLGIELCIVRLHIKGNEIRYYNKNINKIIKQKKEKRHGTENVATEHLKQVVLS